MKRGVTPKQFWGRIQAASRLAELKGSRFEGDSPERQTRRMAEAVVFPERFNATYLPHYFRSAPAAFHLELYRHLEQNSRIVVRAPRGHAKSTVITFAYTLHQVVCAKVLKAWKDGTLEATAPALYQAIRDVMAEAGRTVPLHWDPYIQVVGATEDTGVEFTSSIKVELEENELLRSDWGVLIEGRQSDGDWVSATDVRVRAFGMLGAIRGGKHRQWRPTLVLIDDPDSERTIGTIGVRDSQTRKLTAAVNFGLEPAIGRVFMVGTPLHPDCLVCRFTDPKQHARWVKLRFSAITAEGQPLWPERWTLVALREEEDDDPEAFAMEMLDLPPSTGKPFETIHSYERADFDGLALAKILAFDPALGRTEKADFQALIVLRGPTESGDILVHRVELLRIGDPAELVKRVNDIVGEESPDICVIETIGFQALLECMLSADGRRTSLLNGWVTIESQRESKDLRIRGLAPLVNRGRIRFPSDRTCRALEHQALDYPDGKRDGLDAMEMGVRQLRQTRQGEAVIIHGRRRFGQRDLDEEENRSIFDNTSAREAQRAAGVW